MSDLVQADIFFFISSLLALVVTIGMGLLFYYLVPVARDIREISKKIRRAGEDIEQDFASVRATVREEAVKGKAITDLVLGFVARKLAPKRPRRKKEDPEESSEL
ncbi:MAG: hypothetical protein KBD50_01365 [Candidatus Pacebacteria bacterium]|nr:hypothetical protein [Candidatus Paceibacterota bacterium]